MLSVFNSHTYPPRYKDLWVFIHSNHRVLLVYDPTDKLKGEF